VGKHSPEQQRRSDLQDGDEIYLGHPGVKVLPQNTEDLIGKAHPHVALTETIFKGRPQLEVSYLTSNIGWTRGLCHDH